MSTAAHTRRLVRRETHSSRATAAVVTAVVTILVLLWLGTETVLSMTGRKPLLASPPQIGAWLVGLPQATLPAGMIAAGVGLALIGLILLLLALLPGNRGRHTLASDRNAVVVDDEVIAAAVSRTARNTAALVPEQVSTRISRHSIDVLIHRTSGIGIDEEAVRAAVQNELSGYELTPEPKVKIIISQKGALGV
ncbi:hypothetical protein IV498_00190 [Paenarthrobacter sp. Z7-10]|uniref:DUF6286 domain-containing protein n=1 Tax=Paenarthrobacter sp. Z7-10 TaxID=2787635 RepID=UPI0022A953FF|nr:DUF6286 domain-containing protein [Paenarthrobacter sp. Z7-10]MCZ2401642.1 hypothetical protein [Paenarthrobacter sp. Z7-10]